MGRGAVPNYEKLKARTFTVLMKKHARGVDWGTAVVFAPVRAARIISGQVVRGKANSLIPFLRGVREGLSGK